jgi:hypothetical protein
MGKSEIKRVCASAGLFWIKWSFLGDEDGAIREKARRAGFGRYLVAAMRRLLALGCVILTLSGCAMSDQAEFSRKCEAGIPYASDTSDSALGDVPSRHATTAGSD